MTLETTGALPRLADRSPQISGAEIAASLVPPSQFEHATFDSYRPDHDYPSQSEAVATLKLFAKSWEPQRPAGLFSRSRKKVEAMKPGVYLDGGFGVGKTHLLAALWHEAPGRSTSARSSSTPPSSAPSATRAPCSCCAAPP